MNRDEAAVTAIGSDNTSLKSERNLSVHLGPKLPGSEWEGGNITITLPTPVEERMNLIAHPR